jgi:5'-deoxy-5'-methylthioadenosine phosphorylase
MLAVITGSGFYSLDSLTDTNARTVDTPYGQAVVTEARWNGGPPVLFLPRHGPDHSVAPHLINYRANIWALQNAGATGIIATAVSGGIAAEMTPGSFVAIDDFIDFTSGRPSTFFDERGKVQHTDVTQPYDAALRARIAQGAAQADIALIDGGTYCATNGPRFESKAEIEMMRRLGGDLVGMTGCPEVVLAAELGLPYASIGVISNPAAGLAERDLSVPEIMAVLDQAVAPLERLLGAVITEETS